jgi:hypothetical protein
MLKRVKASLHVVCHKLVDQIGRKASANRRTAYEAVTTRLGPPKFPTLARLVKSERQALIASPALRGFTVLEAVEKAVHRSFIYDEGGPGGGERSVL